MCVLTARFIYSLTDHLPIFCKIDLYTNYVVPHQEPHLLRFTDLNSLAKFLSTYTFDSKYANSDPCNQFNDFHNKIIAIKNNFSFTKIKAIKSAKKDWLSDEILAMVKIKEKLYKKHVRYPGDNFYKAAYKTTARVLKVKIKEAKSAFLVNKFNNLKSSKEQWSFVNDILGIRNKNRTLPSTNNDLNLANSFNDYFVSCTRCDDSSYKNYKPVISPQSNSFLCHEIISEDIQRCITKLNSNVSPGYDNINGNILKILTYSHTHYIASLFNNLLNSGIFPDSLKISIVLPIFKKGDPENLGNYRPISVLPLFSKIFEGVLKERLLNYLKALRHEASSARQSATVSLLPRV